MKNFIVYGHCDKGAKFRPSDWTERLVNTHTTTQQSKQCVHVFNINGIKGIKVKTCLEETNLVLLNQILDFATSNNLVIKYMGEYNEKND
ncbi:hypothetical protein BSPLISOX_3265 [uncultured Gammaproteobacteria bacterium]|jgi:hypothetical protein|nr:hypothetical protein [uncultured Gammaproteobacteria bacterium]VVH66905.1 hypothetical protein BSPLISOX_3265 [uncultured Gammaproteobacteria bacterium]